MHCRKILAMALVALLASSTTVGAALAQGRVGPSYECGAKVADHPLAQIICASDELARLELAYVIAYQALQASTDVQGRKKLTVEAVDFQVSLTEQCDIPKSGVLGRPATPTEIACIKDRLQLQRRVLMSRVSGELLEEAKLLPEETLAIQRALQKKGHLSDTATVDGVIGPATRSAISAWQRSVGRSETGVASRAIISAVPTATPTPAPSQPLELHRGVVRSQPPESASANAQSQQKLCQVIKEIETNILSVERKAQTIDNPLFQKELNAQLTKVRESENKKLKEYITVTLRQFRGFTGRLSGIKLRDWRGKEIVSIAIESDCRNFSVYFGATFADLEELQQMSCAAPLAPIRPKLTSMTQGMRISFDGSVSPFRSIDDDAVCNKGRMHLSPSQARPSSVGERPSGMGDYFIDVKIQELRKL